MEARDHDKIVAVTSHLPYLLSTLLIHRAIETDDERVWPVSASGFRDTSRLAGSDPKMMLDILLTNKVAILNIHAEAQADLQKSHRSSLGENEPALSFPGWQDRSVDITPIARINFHDRGSSRV